MRLVPCPGVRGRAAAARVARGHGRRQEHPRGRRPVDPRLDRVLPHGRAVASAIALIAERVFKEVLERLQFLLDVGLDYLSLNRNAGTLAGGEAQRIRLASQIGSGLVGVLYVLDEPSIGLHQRDNQRLIETLDAAAQSRQHGDRRRARRGDDPGRRPRRRHRPGAGEHGGEIIVSGTVKDLMKSKASITGQYLSGKRKIEVPQLRREPGDSMVAVRARASTTRPTRPCRAAKPPRKPPGT